LEEKGKEGGKGRGFGRTMSVMFPIMSLIPRTFLRPPDPGREERGKGGRDAARGKKREEKGG